MKGQNPISGKIKVIELSQIVSGDTAVYPSAPVLRIESLSTVKQAGKRTTLIPLGTHSGTLVDTPSYVLNEERTVDVLPLEAFCGRAWIFDVGYKAQGSEILPDDLDTGAPLCKRNVALIYTGSKNQHSSRPVLQTYAYLDESAADWLIDKEIRAVGVDSLSVDRHACQLIDEDEESLRSIVHIYNTYERRRCV